uniref:Uncharacterized protein n=1 Tax=Romanomermis culicivorax TaxID=13658 RepID=A0A915KGD9_ROMCU
MWSDKSFSEIRTRVLHGRPTATLMNEPGRAWAGEKVSGSWAGDIRDGTGIRVRDLGYPSIFSSPSPACQEFQVRVGPVKNKLSSLIRRAEYEPKD